MAARLGQVLYWVACGISVLLCLIAVVAFSFAVLGLGSGSWWQLTVAGLGAIVAAAAVWLIGRAVRYVLSSPDG